MPARASRRSTLSLPMQIQPFPGETLVDPKQSDSRRNLLRKSFSQKAVSRKINQPVADRIDNQLGSLVDSQSIHHIRSMDRDRVRAEVERGRDLLI